MDNMSQIEQMLESMEVNFDSSNLIQDNKVVFTHNDNIYRVRMPKHREKVEAEDIRNKKETQLVAEGGCFYKQELKKLLLEKQNINIFELENKKEELLSKLKEIQLKTAVVLSDNQEKIEEYKEEFEATSKELMLISIYITDKLKMSIEDRVEKEAIEYLTSCCTEVLSDKKTEEWTQNWLNYNHFKEDESDLTEKAISKLVYLLINTKE